MFKDLNINNIILYLILKWTGHQFKETIKEVIESYFFTFFRNLDAAFFTDCSQDKDVAGIPENKELQKCNFLKMLPEGASIEKRIGERMEPC